MRARLVGIMFGLAAFFGCDSNGKPTGTIQVAEVKSLDPTLPSVAHPEFANWSQFPEKSFVLRKKVVSNTSGEVEVTTKLWLEKKRDDGVLVGSQVSVKRSDKLVENDSDSVNYPATYRLPEGMEESQFRLPSLKAKEVGTEVVKIGNREVNAQVYEWEERNEAGPSTVRHWRSDEVPGRFVRQELVSPGIETKSIEEVVEVNLATDPG